MSEQLYFTPNEVMELISHVGVDVETVWWAKDQGTYLVGFTQDDEPNIVVYGWTGDGLLLGGGPDPTGDVWDATRFICGGDDFAEDMTSSLDMIKNYKSVNVKALMFDIEPDSFGVTWVGEIPPELEEAWSG